MRKKKTLYEVNRWNRPAFMPKETFFDIGGSLGSGNLNNPRLLSGTPNFNTNSYGTRLYSSLLGSLSSGASTPTYSNTAGYKSVGDYTRNAMSALSSVTPDFTDSSQSGAALTNIGGIVNNWKSIAGKTAQEAGFSDYKPSNNSASTGKSNFGQTAMGIAAAIPDSPITIGGKTYKRGLFDAADPLHHLAGNNETGIGNVAGDAGVSMFKAGAASGNGMMMLAGAGLKAVGSLTNALFGEGVDEEADASNKAGMAAYNNFVSNAGSFDEVRGPVAQANYQDAHTGGLFKKGSARRKNEDERQQFINAKLFADRSILNNVNNLAEDQLNNALATYAAFGGPIETIGDNNMGAIGYGFMSDYLAAKKKQADSKNQMTNMFMGTPNTMFAFGGDIQTNSADFPSGLMHIDAGGSHEESPYDGVQMGVDQNGVPNLVEEGEVVWDDYVFSNRIELDEEAKKKFHFPKKKDITYAEAAKKLEKEIAERPNDPISRAGFEAQMQTLEEEQERQKQEMEAERAKAAFEALSPEKQVAVMENAAQQEQMAQQAAMQEQAMAQQQAQPSPEEQAMMQQQMMQADGSPAMVGQEAPMMAEGGHLYKGGGDKKKNVGTWKDNKENHWDVFTKPGLKKYIENIRQRLAMAPDDETKAAIRREAMNELNTLQQSYYDYIRRGAADAVHGYDDKVLNHQKMFDRLYGNTGFYTTDENGNVRNLIADAINLPNGAATDDKPDNWFDGYNGPRTSIRNFGSTAYGDDKYYQDLVNEFKELGLTYAPNDNWKDDNGVLYGLSIPEEEAAKEAAASAPKSWDWNTGDWIDRAPVEGTVASAVTPKQKAAEAAKAKEETRRIVPIHTNPIFGIEDVGPLVSMGLMAAKVGKPDTGSLFSAVRGAGDVALADWMPRGDFAVYRPDDSWFYTSPIIAQSNATQRAIGNKVSPTKGAETLANSYNTMTALGQAQRQQLDSNFDKYMKVKQYNGTIYDANQKEYGQNSRFNANARNDAARSAAQLNLTAAREAMDANAAFDQNWYGNIGALTKAIGARRKENRTRNMIADMAATGIFGNMNPDTFIANGMLRYETDEERRKRLSQPAAEGGKIKNRRRLKI